MKTILTVASVFLLFLYIPLGIYQTYLLYQHVHATELMWFLWLINIPFIIVSAIIGSLLKAASDK